ncbi:class I SAM-dependent methyltransferase [Spirillospora sp. CA-294931]|uniref:class I SAM-dependent methyltransferase n=1 Tax=Spirillospora sp. CA-294931 TaxID=3240042 RepID=UPI003D8EEC3E
MTDHLSEARRFYDTIADDYVVCYGTELAENVMGRAFLGAFAELAAGGKVADVGCGPGHTTALLDSLGVDVFGLDLSPGMIAHARRALPAVRFEEGTMTELPVADGALSGIVAWYSIIHLPPELVPDAIAEFHRALAPGGHLVLAFQIGDEPLRVDQPHGHPVALDSYRWQPDRVTELLADAGFVMAAHLTTPPNKYDTTPQAYLLAHKPDEHASDQSG